MTEHMVRINNNNGQPYITLPKNGNWKNGEIVKITRKKFEKTLSENTGDGDNCLVL